MKLISYLTVLLFGTAPKMRRVLSYWAATAILYAFCCSLVVNEVNGGRITAIHGQAVLALTFFGILAFYILLRSSATLGIPNWKLAFAQAIFAIVFDLALYTVLEPVRGAVLIGMPIVILFCAFALRPRQTIWLSSFAVAALAATITTLAFASPGLHPLYEESVHFALATIGIVCVTTITGELSKLRTRLIHAVATIRNLATTDELTLLSNRRHMRDVLAEHERRDGSTGLPVCVAIIDVDYFKTINDRYGHAAGDAVLRAFADTARVALRSADTLARWGGEEFLLFMPDTEQRDALAVIDRIAERVRMLRFDSVDADLRVTFSAGVAACHRSERIDEGIRRADEAMYRAKENGRDCVLPA